MNSSPNSPRPSNPSNRKSNSPEINQSRKEIDLMILQIESHQLFNKLQYDRTASIERISTLKKQVRIIDLEIEELRKEVGK